MHIYAQYIRSLIPGAKQAIAGRRGMQRSQSFMTGEQERPWANFILDDLEFGRYNVFLQIPGRLPISQEFEDGSSVIGWLEDQARMLMHN